MLSRQTAVTTVVTGLGLLLVGLLGGCADTMRDEQLARVAKDWSLVVRASQVIPVYPLTEDLVPGDIFLVRMSIPQQHREYQSRGFLPMDMHLTRLHGLDYAGIYLNSYGTKDKDNTPYHWQFPPDGDAPATVDDLRRLLRPPQAVTGAGPQNGGGAGTGGAKGGNADPNKPQPRQDLDPTLWRTAPRAAFPSYTFQVDSRGGIQAALPIHGVPVALSMMQTDKAFGSVTLSDAYTYGVPYDQIIESVKKWAADPNHRDTLQKIRNGVNKGNTWASVLEDGVKFIMLDQNERTVYLRVVSRVYVVGSVTVALINTRQGAADAQIGAPRNIEMLNPALQAPKTPQASSQPASGNTNSNVAADAKKADAALANLNADPSKAASNFQKALEAVNANLGGAAKLQWATARSVALDENFPRPLVIGYLGFDFPINRDGSLGTPVATQCQLERAGGTKKYSPTASNLRDRITRWLAADREKHVRALTSWLARKGIDIPAGIWVRSEAATPTDLTDAIRDLEITE
jgi:hypothetical protein